MALLKLLEENGWATMGIIQKKTKISDSLLYECVLQGYIQYKPFKIKKYGKAWKYPIAKLFLFNQKGKDRFYGDLKKTVYYKLNKEKIDKENKTTGGKIFDDLRKRLEEEDDSEEEQMDELS